MHKHSLTPGDRVRVIDTEELAHAGELDTVTSLHFAHLPGLDGLSLAFVQLDRGPEWTFTTEEVTPLEPANPRTNG